MLSRTTTFAALALAGLVASASCDASPDRFKWAKCPFEDKLAEEMEIPFDYECSNFTAPLDYLDDKGNKTINLQLTRIPAPNGDSQGTIFFNFGGPGIEARAQLVGEGERYLTMTGGKFDLVAFDPRGTADTAPFHCYNDTTRVITGLKHRLLDVVGPEDEPGLARKWASGFNYASDCLTSEESAPELGELVGTGYVARDIVQMLNAIEGEDALLNYYGLSYGTILGSTFAALFPDRVGRLVLDGNVNVHEWYNGFELAWFEDADNALLDLFERCVDAGHELCPLAARNETAEMLNDRFYKTVESLRTAPIPLGSTFVLDPGALKTGLRIALYSPENYLPLTVVFDELFKPANKRNTTALAEAWIPLAESANFDSLPDDSPSGIMCGDKTLRFEEFSDVYPDLANDFMNVSRSLGEHAINLDYPCFVWPWHAKGAYNGSWHEEIETANPMLFIGNTYDPVSPIASARNTSAIFKDSAVLEHGGIGHGSPPHPSLCTAKAMRAYFLDGELPEKDTKCETDYGVFDQGKTWKDALLPEMSYD